MAWLYTDSFPNLFLSHLLLHFCLFRTLAADNRTLTDHEIFTVVGAQEAESRTVNIRNRDDQSTQSKGELIPLQEALEHLVKLRDEKRRINAF